jgi:hypothetical protein
MQNDDLYEKKTTYRYPTCEDRHFGGLSPGLAQNRTDKWRKNSGSSIFNTPSMFIVCYACAAHNRYLYIYLKNPGYKNSVARPARSHNYTGTGTYSIPVYV